MKRVLMTGASGFVGSGVLEWLLGRTDWTFTCVCSWRHRGNPLNIKPDPRVDVVTLDLVGPLPDLGRFDYILHLAAESHVDRSLADPVATIETNVSSTLQVLEYARRHSPETFLQFSCYDATTQAVTRDGLKSYDRIEVGDEVLSLNPETGVVEWKPVVAVIVQDYSGDMVRFRSASVNLLVTPNHRMLVRETDGKIIWREASEQAARSVGYLPGGYAPDSDSSSSSERDLLFLVGAYIGDGHTYHDVKRELAKTGMSKAEYMAAPRTNNGRFTPHVPTKEHVTEQNSYRTFFEVPYGDKARARLLETLDRIGVKYTATAKNVYLGGKKWYDLFSACGRGSRNKHIPARYQALGRADLEVLFDGLLITDGHRRPSGICQYTTISPVLASQVTALAYQLGWKVSSRIHPARETAIGGRRVIGGDAYYLSLTRTAPVSINKYIATREPYLGKIWCLRVKDNKNFLVEREGNFAFCGNTDEVFGAVEHKEWDAMLPSNPYAASKAAAEMVAISYWNAYRVPIVITNSNNIVGPRQNREKFVPKLIDLVSRGECVDIHVDSDGRPGRRHYNSVRNVADALFFILGRPRVRGSWPERYGLPGGEEVDNLEMARRVAALLSLPLRHRLVDAETVRPGYDRFYPQPDGMLTVLGWRPVVTLADELARVVSRRPREEP